MNRPRSDCARCRGLCCTELFFSKAEGFPQDKPAGVPCLHLGPDFRCRVHGDLAKLGLRGCMAYECFGAGQAASALCPPGDGRVGEEFARQYRLGELRWYLADAAPFSPRAAALLGSACPDPEEARLALKAVVAARTGGKRPKGDLVGRRFHGGQLRESDLCMTLLLAAGLRGCDLTGTALLGADLRDADLSGADLRGTLFLTQRQLNAARGDGNTRLPPHLRRPDTWQTAE